VWGLSDVLISKYQIDYLEAKNLASFLLPMLSLDPAQRVTAKKHLEHPWLRGLPSDELNAHFLPNAPQPVGTYTGITPDDESKLRHLHQVQQKAQQQAQAQQSQQAQALTQQQQQQWLAAQAQVAAAQHHFFPPFTQQRAW